MLDRSNIHRAMLAAVVASGMAFGSATLPNLTVHNPSILYVLGQVRMALGDSEGGFRLVSRAAAAREAQQTASAPVVDKKPATPGVCKDSSKSPVHRSAVSSSVTVATVRSPQDSWQRPQGEPHGTWTASDVPERFRTASLDVPDVEKAHIDAAWRLVPSSDEIQAQIDRARIEGDRGSAFRNAHQNPEAQRKLREAMRNLRQKFEREGVPVSPNVIALIQPPTVSQESEVNP